MGRNITVTFADGSSHVYQNAPDGVTPEQVSARAAQEFGKEVAALDGGKEPSMLDRGIDAVKNIGTAAVKGIVTPITSAVENAPRTTLPGLLQLGRDAIQTAVTGEKPLNATKEVHEFGYKPKTPGEKYVASGVEGATASVYGPGGKLKYLIGTNSGLGSEAAAQLFGDNPLTRILGGLAGGLGTSAATSFSPTNKTTLAREALRDADPVDLQRAIKEMDAAHKAGLTTNISQHMRDPSNLDAYVDALANNPNGTTVTKQLRDQPRQVSFLSEVQKQELPGAVRPERDIANNAQEAADAAIRAKMKEATAAWEKNAPLDAKLPSSAVALLDRRLKAMGDRHLDGTSARDLFEEVRAALKRKAPPANTPAGQLIDANGVPFNAPGQAPKYHDDAFAIKEAIDDVLSNFGSRKLNTPNLDAKLQRRAQEIREAWRDVIDTNAPQLSKANAAYSAVMDSSVNPAKKGVVGFVAQPGGSVQDKQAAVSRVFNVLDKGTLPDASVSEIRTLGKEFRKVQQSEVFDDAVKTWFAKGIDKAMQSSDGRMPEDAAKRLTQYFGSLNADTAKTRGLRDMLSVVAENKGLSPQETSAYIRGFENWMTQINAAAKRPASAMGTNPADIAETASSTATKHLGNVSLITPLRQPALWWSRLVGANSLKEMDKLLTSPEGVRTLVEMGTKPAMSKVSQDLMTNFIVTGLMAEQSNPTGVTAP